MNVDLILFWETWLQCPQGSFLTNEKKKKEFVFDSMNRKSIIALQNTYTYLAEFTSNSINYLSMFTIGIKLRQLVGQ